ncbi:MAG: RusA family crossover junction endodeoxyribonuclease [Acidimicrobiales bacterium]|nr:RusA family crossover junction endodeoxyribonuclease [Acidimicrobiales bacterium]
MTDDGAIRFEVRGFPAPQGALKVGMAGGRAHLFNRSSGPLRDWRGAVASAAQPHAPTPVWDGPVSVALAFRLPQPRSRPTTVGRGKKKRAVRIWPDRKPDVDKLVRAVLDALSGVVFMDDSQVVRLTASKDYGDPGVVVEVSRVADGGGGGPA